MPKNKFPKHIAPNEKYKGEQIMSLVTSYVEIVEVATWAEYYGPGLDAPDVVRGALENLLEAQTALKSLPKEIEK